MIEKRVVVEYAVSTRYGEDVYKSIEDATWCRFQDVIFYRFGVDADEVVCTCDKEIDGKEVWARPIYPLRHQETCHYRRLFERYVRYVKTSLGESS